ncbi:uncharacterized protein BJX67DRAFT_226120 [Aspergillus lucknowensis]|uniref:Uncharacterized protein n=1 Tax=Aspergillus lucknowensis TaxID=176173 RepID=A0ABR4LI78_9EURO
MLVENSSEDSAGVMIKMFSILVSRCCAICRWVYYSIIHAVVSIMKMERSQTIKGNKRSEVKKKRKERKKKKRNEKKKRKKNRKKAVSSFKRFSPEWRYRMTQKKIRFDVLRPGSWDDRADGSFTGNWVRRISVQDRILTATCN